MRWTELRRPAADTRRRAIRRWIESNLVGAVLSGLVLVPCFKLPAGRLPEFAAVTLATAAALELLRHPLVLRQGWNRVAAFWARAWPAANALFGAVVLVWLWQRLASSDSQTPAPIYLTIALGAGAAGWLTRSWSGTWLTPLAALVNVLPCGWLLLDPPLGSSAVSLLPFLAAAIGSHLILRRWTRQSNFDPSDLACLWLLTLSGLWLVEPFLNTRATGAGDSHWYALVTADALAQYRAGIFPLVGQSEYAINGSTFPGCYAPYYQVFSIALDLLSGRTLSVYAIQHLTVVLSLLGGIFSAYAVLRLLAPTGWRAPAALLAFLYAASPAWLGAIYSMDMYMTFMTLPWLPFAFLGCARTFVRLDRRALLWLVPSLSLVWYAHPPVALWTTIVVAVTQLFRWCVRPQGWAREITWLAAAAGLFLALTGLPFATAANADPQVEPSRYDHVLETLQTHRAAWFPVSAGADQLSDQQLGWGLAVVLVAGGVLALRRKARAFAGLLAAAAGIWLVLAPIPGVQSLVWRLLPETIRMITDNWPSQRLYPLLAALASIGAGGVLLRAFRHRPALLGGLVLFLAGAVVWSATEAAKFRRRGHTITLDAATSARRFYPENLVLTRYAYEMFTHKPDYVANGVINPILRQRLLSVSSQEQITSNLSHAHAQPLGQTFVLTSEARGRGSYELSPSLTLQPGRDYLIEFEFPGQKYDGELSLEGDRIERRYRLPRDGGIEAFGSAPDTGKFLTLATKGNVPETVTWHFQSISFAPPSRFATVRVSEFDRAQLPVQTESLLPYRAIVRSPSSAWLETPRMFLPGYAASINGRAAEVRPSPQGLVMIRVPAGASEVSLAFTGSLLLRTALWLAAASWVSLPVLFLIRRRIAGARKIQQHPPFIVRSGRSRVPLPS